MYETLKAAGYEPDGVYRECVRLLSQSAISAAKFEPPGLKEGGYVQQKGQLLEDEYALPWHGDAMVDFLESAKRLPHPRQHPKRDLPQDVLDAVSVVVGKGLHITEWRKKKLQLIQDVAARLSGMNATMHADMPPHVQHVCQTYHVSPCTHECYM